MASTDDGTDRDLAALRAQHPDWFFTTAWVAAGSGPDRRMIVAQRGVVVSDFSPAAVSAKIRYEDQRLIPPAG